MRRRESSAHARGKSAQQKEEQLRAEAEKEQAKPPRFEPVWYVQLSGAPLIGASGSAGWSPRSVPASVRQDRLNVASLTHVTAGLAAFLTWIAHQGYQVENHAVLTADGYILNVQRIHSSTLLMSRLRCPDHRHTGYMEDLRTTTEPPKPKPVCAI